MSIHVGTLLDEKVTWCGATITEGLNIIKDAEAAAISGKFCDDVIMCEFCINAIVNALYKNRS